MLRRFTDLLSCRTAGLTGAAMTASLAMGLALAPQTVQAQGATPSQQEFNLRYFFIEPDGSRGRQLVTRDFQTLFNRARCQCGEKVRVVLQRPRGNPWDPGIMEIRVGRQCDRAAVQSNVGNQNLRTCLLLQRMINPQGDFLTDVIFDIPLYWFASGVKDITVDQFGAVPPPIPERLCPEITGDTGIWMCFGQDSCQQGEYFYKPQVAGAQSQGTPGLGGAKKSTSVKKITSPLLDLLPPESSQVFDPRVNPGDGSVQIEWDTPSDANVVGFRVLCRKKNDPAWRSPEGQKVIETYPGDRERFKLGTIYQLPQYLGYQCSLPPEIAALPTPGKERERPRPRPKRPEDSEAYFWQASSSTGSTGTSSNSSTGGATGTQSTGTSGTQSGTDSTGAAAEGSNKEQRVDPTLGSLDWAYICSDNLPGTTRRARVDGLENSEEYLFQLVAYDLAGNPALIGNTASGVPQATVDYWDACNENNVNRCGKLGYCSLSEQGALNPMWGLLLLAFGFRPRKDKSCS